MHVWFCFLHLHQNEQVINTKQKKKFVSVSKYLQLQNVNKRFTNSLKRRRKQIQTVWITLSILQPFSLLAVHTQQPLLSLSASVNSFVQFHKSVVSTSGPNGIWEPHLPRFSAMINLLTTLFLLQEDWITNWLYTMCLHSTTQTTHGSTWGM